MRSNNQNGSCNTSIMNVGFFVRHFTERGTEVSVYDYAKYNEDVLKNKSFIICFQPETQKMYGLITERASYAKFCSRFPVIEISSLLDMPILITVLGLTHFYTQTHGDGGDIYEFNNKAIWGNCKTIKHCVFHTTFPESDFYISISETLNVKNNTDIPVIPYIVDLPEENTNLRDELQIPSDAMVFGRYGGMYEFNILIAHEAIKQHVNTNPNCYFLFMNTDKFYEHPRIIYLDKNVDMHYKVRFINTCDAMIHAREGGETFGLAIAEFSIKNKPIITCNSGDTEHIRILADRAILYHSVEELLEIFSNIKTIIHSRDDWNAYTLYSPEYVMGLFKQHIFDK